MDNVSFYNKNLIMDYIQFWNKFYKICQTELT